MKVYNNGINPNLVQQLQTKSATNTNNANNANKLDNNANSFSEVFSKVANTSEEKSLEFSKHAVSRLDSRNITFSDNQLERIENGVDQARQKGIKDSLLLVDNVALIVNVKNNVVVTAVNDSKEKVFTNIDGAIIV